MLYTFPRNELKILMRQEFSKKYFNGEITLRNFLNWFEGFEGELGSISQNIINNFRELATKNPGNLLSFDLYDGTKSPGYGKILFSVLQEIGKLIDMIIYPLPGEKEVYGYNFATSLVSNCFDNKRKKIDLDKLCKLLNKVNIMQHNLHTHRLFIFKQDMFYPSRNNWCYGFVMGGNYYSVAFYSIARISNDYLLYDLFAHELGHILGIPKRGRSNTISDLGIHCTNNLCVMQQKAESDDALNYTNLRHNRKAQLFCNQCINDIKQFRSTFSIRDLELEYI